MSSVISAFTKRLPLLIAMLASMALFAAFLQGAQATGLLSKKERVYPFSGFSGQLRYHGKPAAFAKVIRSYQLLDKTHEEAIYTDQYGRFTFDSVVTLYTPPSLNAVEFLSYQEVHVEYQGSRFQIWGGSKVMKNEFTEFGGEPTNFQCEITDQIYTVENGFSFVTTNCYWHEETQLNTGRKPVQTWKSYVI